MRLAADIETNGLLDKVSQFHCAVATDIDTGMVHKFRPGQMDDFINLCEQADLVAFHNGIKYDHPALEKLSGRTIRQDNMYDTLVGSRLIYANVGDKTYREPGDTGRFGTLRVNSMEPGKGSKVSTVMRPLMQMTGTR